MTSDSSTVDNGNIERGPRNLALQRPLQFWIDLENLTCVTFFSPIIRRLSQLGHRMNITYRACPHMSDLMSVYSLTGHRIGASGGKSKLRKTQKGLLRALLLFIWARTKQIDLAIGFGARPLSLCARLLRLPNATVIDYEHVSLHGLRDFCDWIFAPADVKDEFWEARRVQLHKLIRFAGLKEDVYVPGHRIDTTMRSRLGIAHELIVALVRPPAHMAHYHDSRSELILQRVLERVSENPSVVAILIPRDFGQSDQAVLKSPRVRALPFPVNGLDLVAAADLTISGGGTMVREAAALGVSAYSIFTGQIGAIDARLAQEGKLTLIRDIQQVAEIAFQRKSQEPKLRPDRNSALEFFVQSFVELGASRHVTRRHSLGC